MSPKQSWRAQWQGSDVQIQAKKMEYKGFCQIMQYQIKHPLFSGGLSPLIVRERVERRSAAAVVLYDPEQEVVVLIEQFRIGPLGDPKVSPWLLEVVAGLVDEGESPTQTVFREAKEEAGCEILSLIPIVDYYTSPGGFSEKTSLFCGLVKAPPSGGVFGVAAEGEDIKVHVLALQNTLEMVAQGVICNGSTIIALQWLAQAKSKVETIWHTITLQK